MSYLERRREGTVSQPCAQEWAEAERLAGLALVGEGQPSATSASGLSKTGRAAVITDGTRLHSAFVFASVKESSWPKSSQAP